MTIPPQDPAAIDALVAEGPPPAEAIVSGPAIVIDPRPDLSALVRLARSLAGGQTPLTAENLRDLVTLALIATRGPEEVGSPLDVSVERSPWLRDGETTGLVVTIPQHEVRDGVIKPVKPEPAVAEFCATLTVEAAVEQEFNVYASDVEEAITEYVRDNYELSDLLSEETALGIEDYDDAEFKFYASAVDVTAHATVRFNVVLNIMADPEVVSGHTDEHDALMHAIRRAGEEVFEDSHRFDSASVTTVDVETLDPGHDAYGVEFDITPFL